MREPLRRCARRLAALTALTALTALCVVGAACAPRERSCPEQTEITIGSEFIGTEPREIDFGFLEAGLSASVRVSFVVACGLFVESVSAGTQAGVFSVGESLAVGGGEEGFVFVSAHPITTTEARGGLLINDDAEGLLFPLVVNAGR